MILGFENYVKLKVHLLKEIYMHVTWLRVVIYIYVPNHKTIVMDIAGALNYLLGDMDAEFRLKRFYMRYQ